jgi:Leucine Rich repeat
LSDINLGNDLGARLLSGISSSIEELSLLHKIGLTGLAGGAIISDLLQSMPNLKTLRCSRNPLGARGAQALYPGLAAHPTLKVLDLRECMIRSQGLLAVVDALVEGTTTIEDICLDGNRIRANGLAHLTRLFQHSSSVEEIDVDNNPGLFCLIMKRVQDPFFVRCKILRSYPCVWILVDYLVMPSLHYSKLSQSTRHYTICLFTTMFSFKDKIVGVYLKRYPMSSFRHCA